MKYYFLGCLTVKGNLTIKIKIYNFKYLKIEKKTWFMGF